jgi:8-oxo-dGTP pyrophosphatase MutT (NUDIX family)
MRYEVVELKGNARLPILSVGVIAISWVDGVPRYLLINRKDSMPFCDIIRRRYPITDAVHLQGLVDALTNAEKVRLLTESHASLWADMWGSIRSSGSGEERTAAACFAQLQSSGMLAKAIEQSTTSWEETEWEFPKGRKSYQERDQMCALREFQEETGIPSSCLQLVSNVVPIEETYTGTNGKAYRHRYYLGFIPNPDVDLSRYQRSEVKEARWMDYETAMERIRGYHIEKRRALTIAAGLVRKFRIMSAEDSRDGRQRPGRTESWGRSNWGVRPPGASA